MNEIAACYKFYDKSGNRMAAFCHKVSEGTIHEIYLLRCSKKDQFNKRLARKIYNEHINGTANYEYHPKVVFLKPHENDGTLKTLLKFLALNFYIGVNEYEMRPVFNLYNGINKQVVKSWQNPE